MVKCTSFRRKHVSRDEQSQWEVHFFGCFRKNKTLMISSKLNIRKTAKKVHFLMAVLVSKTCFRRKKVHFTMALLVWRGIVFEHRIANSRIEQDLGEVHFFVCHFFRFKCLQKTHELNFHRNLTFFVNFKSCVCVTNAWLFCRSPPSLFVKKCEKCYHSWQ